MKTIDISIKHLPKKYSVFVGKNLIENLSDFIVPMSYSNLYVISDANVANYYLKSLEKALASEFPSEKIHTFIVRAGEKSKQLSTVESIYHDMAKRRLDRNSLVINLGGGVVTDLGGFTASTYMRGLPFINLATTLEGMVDASVGGKTGVNLGRMKNYVGTISQPKAVLADISVLDTLPRRTFIQGYAEVIKHGLIADKQYFEDVSRKSFLEFTDKEKIEIVARSIEIKSEIVRQDEFEVATRKLLNFGHTIGHALESLSLENGESLFHGEAVAIGMIAEAKISLLCGMITEEEFKKIEEAIKRVGLPTKFQGTNRVDDIHKLLISDKKNIHGKIKWTLLSAIGSGEENVEVAERFVRVAIKSILC